MRLQFVQNPDLSPLAWLATVSLTDGVTTIVHGRWVELQEDGLVEGVWDGPFEELGLGFSAYVFGSGVVRQEHGILFVSSTSTTDYLYWQQTAADKVVVANTLPLLLAAIGDQLDSACREYPAINASIMSGISSYVRKIPTEKGFVNRLMHANLQVTLGGVAEVTKLSPARFAGYCDYVAHLESVYQRLAKNARDPARHHPMAIFSTQSRGYDSTAANAIAARFGVDGCFTITRGKGIGRFADSDAEYQSDDDGSEICAVLGITPVAIERRALEEDSSREYLYYATMHQTGDFNFDQFRVHLDRPTVLITGCLGEIWSDQAWHLDRPGLVDSELRRVDLGNHALTEVRLDAGYVQLPFPYIGARSREDIFRITNATEMGRWRLGTSYDRPIPRRIAEERGVARRLFGQEKMASELQYAPPVVPINSDLRRAYFDFVVKEGLLRRWQLWCLPAVRKWNSLQWTTTPQRHAWNYYLQRLVSKILRREFEFPQAWTWLSSALFCFCVNRRAAEYRIALTK